MDLNTLSKLYQIAFTHGRSWRFGKHINHFRVARAGILILSSGHIVACDPLVSGEREPFVQAVLPGRYPVDLSLARREGEKEERIVLARVLFTKNAPVMWIKAMTAAQSEQEEKDVYGYHSSTGTGAFMDAESAARFRLETIIDVDRMLDRLMANYQPVRNWLEYPLTDRHNIIFFTSGFDEGFYPSYFAVDSAGDVCILLTVCSRQFR